ncbi:hypothetical protein FOY91_17720 [Sphingomonas solaris]|uniref:TraB/GumN family protein n=1 Tax=Alterirhizorhabdus solaris TaxID=2529389 RepID=A0A558QV52_9SPHN|nr:hypothetical protein FOY91_17720 [Sphingomonas solaris]
MTQVTPAMVPQATLTNGVRTIVFQGMQHVGTEPFYKSVVYDLESALSDDYALFYEGVRPANPADDAWFDRTVTGGADLGTTYRDLAGLCGLRFQNDYFGLLARDARLHPASHVVADVSTADLHAEYDRLMRTDAVFADAMREKERARAGAGSVKPDGLERIVAFMRSGTDGQREIGGVLCRGFMTLVMRKDASADSEDQSEKLILDYRNRVLARALLDDPRPRIYVTYGAKHLPGVLRLLQRNDPRWRIASVKWLRTIDRPDDLTGTIR